MIILPNQESWFERSCYHWGGWMIIQEQADMAYGKWCMRNKDCTFVRDSSGPYGLLYLDSPEECAEYIISTYKGAA